MHYLKSKWPALIAIFATFVGCAAPPAPPPAPPAVPTTAQAGATTVVAVAPPAEPCCPPASIWDILGVGQIMKGVGGLVGGVRNCLGTRFPGLEAKPAIKAITDPANMGPDAPPAVSAAAAAKTEEDAAAQKVKALRYLATLGCGGCYPDVEDALLQALNDCTELVRFEAVRALRDAAGQPCQTCKSSSCCSEKVLKRLDEVANKMGNDGCYVEPSARVRRLARVAMANCGGATGSAEPEENLPAEGPAGGGGEGGEGPVEGAPIEEAAEQTAALVRQAKTVLGAPENSAATETSSQSNQIIPVHNHAPGRDCPACRRRAEVNRPNEHPLVLARVNGETITEADVLGPISAGEKIDPIAKARRLEQMQRELAAVVELRLLFQEASRQLPWAQISQVSFADSPGLTPAQRERKHEESVVNHWLEKQLQVDPLVSEAELFNAYRANLSKYRQAGAVQWEMLRAPLAKFPSSQQAREAIEQLRDQAQGVQVSIHPAVRRNVEITTHGWTEQNQVSTELTARMLFGMPAGKISPVLEDEKGFYIVRVLAYRPARTMPLAEVTEQVREEVLELRRFSARSRYVQRLRAQANVWTVFDQQPATGSAMKTR